MKIQTVCICGAGTMGLGIAQVCAAAGYSTLVYDVHPEALDRARQRLEGDLQKLVDRGKLPAADREALLQRLRFSHLLSDCQADLVIEAIIEKPGVKVELFKNLSVHNAAATIFASNTSSLSISDLARALDTPQVLAGLHFFNPAPLMKLVEVIRGQQTPEETIEELLQFTRSLGKTPVACLDRPGFIVNRVARPYYIESLRLAEAGADPALIDRLLESRGFRMGPFHLMDLIGNDVNYAVSCSVYEQLDHPERLRPSPLQKQKVDEGALGRKSGRGYFDY